MNSTNVFRCMRVLLFFFALVSVAAADLLWWQLLWRPKDLSPPEHATSQCISNFRTQGPSVRSRYDEDVIMYETFFRDQRMGERVFVEIGAVDGLKESNSHFFSKCLKWKGLLVEGNPTQYAKLTRNRPGTMTYFGSPTCHHESNVTFWSIDYTNAGLKGYATKQDHQSSHYIRVPCFPLQKVFDFYSITHVDFFSLDVEGAELLVLQTVDFAKTQIRVLMVESKNRDCGRICPKREKVRSFLKQQGYRLNTTLIKASDVFYI